MQIIDDPGKWGGVRNTAQSSLDSIINMKMQSLHQKHAQSETAKGLQALGISPDKARQLAPMVMANPKEFMSELAPLMGGLVQQPSEQAAQQEIAPQMQQQRLVRPQEPVAAKPVSQFEQMMTGLNKPQAAPTAPQEIVKSVLQGGYRPELVSKTAPRPMAPEQAPRPRTVAALRAQQAAQASQQEPAVIKQLAAKPLTRTGQAVEAQKQKMTATELKEQRAEQRAIDKETAPVYKELNNEYKDTKANEKRLDRMETLVKKGNLSYSLFHNLYDTIAKGIWGIGFDLHFLETADSQEFNKLSNEFLKNAKNIFGARLTDYDVKSFMQMVPSLSQSDEGKMRIIENMKSYGKGVEIRKKAMDQIIKENGGKRPADLEEQIDSRTEEQLDALAENFKTGAIHQGLPKDKNLGLGLVS